MPDIRNSARHQVRAILAFIGLLSAAMGIAIHFQPTKRSAADTSGASATITETLSEEEIANILQHGTLIKEAAPPDSMRPDGYDSAVFEFHGARYVIHTGGLSGHHRYGSRLPNTK